MTREISMLVETFKIPYFANFVKNGKKLGIIFFLP